MLHHLEPKSCEFNMTLFFINWMLTNLLSLSFFSFSQHRGSAIAKIVGANAAQNSKFDDTVKMWVFEEMVNGRKLTEIINTDHENVKYLPGHKLPANVVRNMLISCHLTVIQYEWTVDPWFPLSGIVCLFKSCFKPLYFQLQHILTAVCYTSSWISCIRHKCHHLVFPPSQLAVPDLVEASRDADILVFVIPHQFIGRVCDTMKDKIKSDALGISLIKVWLC